MNFSKDNGVYAPIVYRLQRAKKIEENRQQVKDLFSEFKDPLLKLTNNRFGRKLLGIEKETKNKVIYSITPNAWTERIGRNTYRQKIRGYDIFTKRLYYPILLALQYQKAKKFLQFERNPLNYACLAQYASLLGYFGLAGILAKTLPLFVGASGDKIYSGAGDGGITGGAHAWATSHDEATGDYLYNDAIGHCCYIDTSVYLERSTLPFDTTGILSNASISAAVLGIKVYAVDMVGHGDGKDYIALVQTWQADHTALALGDFGSIGYDSGNETSGRAKYTPIVEGSNRMSLYGLGIGVNEFTLDATGRGWIKKNGEASTFGDEVTGWSNLGIREGHDLQNTVPTGTNYYTCQIYFSEQADTTSDPYLTPTYTTAGSASASPSVSASSSISPSPSVSVSLSISPSPSVSVSATPSVSVSATPSVSVSLSISKSPSVSSSVSVSATPSVSVSLSKSASPSVSVSATPSISVSLSVSKSPSISESASVSATPSVSVSLSISKSPSLSLSGSPSFSISASPSLSPSVSVSLSKSPSPSVSVSATPSISASVSVSFSPSISASISKSASPSISVSSTPSVSASISASISASASISLSPSPSPSPGFADYTRGIYDTLPSGILDLTFPYTTEDVIKVSTKNAEYVEQSGTSKYLIHQYKNFVGDQLGCQLELLAQSTQAPSVSRVYLQIFNRDTPAWETIDSDNTTGADTDFILKVDIASLTNYKDASGVIVCRTYQLAV